jgi:hypothetical protein
MSGNSLPFWFRCLDLDGSGELTQGMLHFFIKSRFEQSLYVWI